MNIPYLTECDLPQDLLSESPAISSVRTSPQLTKNMSGSPFSRKAKLAKLTKMESWPGVRAADSLENDADGENMEFQSLKLVPWISPGRKNLRQEIKDLLKEAARIREWSPPLTEVREKDQSDALESWKSSPYFGREVTMGDVESA